MNMDGTQAFHGHSSDSIGRDSGPPTALGNKQLHRIATVRNQEGMSLRSVSRQMGKPISVVRDLEDESNDLRISQLLDWERILRVPLQDLLVEPADNSLSQPVMARAQLVRLMKTAAALQEQVNSGRSGRLVAQLVQQLIEVMPELKGVTAWHAVGQRRSPDEFGRAFERPLNDEFFARS